MKPTDDLKDEHGGVTPLAVRRDVASELLGRDRRCDGRHRVQPRRHRLDDARIHPAVACPLPAHPRPESLTSRAACSGSVVPSPYAGHCRDTGQAPQAGLRA